LGESGVRKALSIISVLIAITAVALSTAFYFSSHVQDRVFAFAARKQLLRANQVPLTNDAIRVILCGTSSPLPTRTGAKSCNLVSVGGRLFLVDIGPEASENLGIWRVPTPKIEAAFITHFHSDHIGELGEVNMQGWAQGRTTPLKVYGATGIKTVVAGFNQAYSFDHSYRNALHAKDRGLLPLSAAAIEPREFALPLSPDARGVRSVVVYDQDGIRVTAIKTNHAPVDPAVSYRFDYKGRSVVFTGDTTYYRPLAMAAVGADVIVGEGQASHLQDIVAREADAVGQTTLGSVLRDTRTYHITPVQAAQLANEARVRMLVFSHIAPPIVNPVVTRPWLRWVSAVRPNGVMMGYDGMMITIPVDGSALRFDQLEG
jgi:ribonuclease Z